jgi:hypothetical protein
MTSADSVDHERGTATGARRHQDGADSIHQSHRDCIFLCVNSLLGLYVAEPSASLEDSMFG